MLTKIFPFLSWPRPTRASLKDDLIAGLTVALIGIPQSLAYAQLAGIPPYYGLYAALLPCIIGALFGSSAQLSTGPVALTSLLTAASVAPLAQLGSSQYITYVIVLALLSGIFQFAFGVMRLGVFLNLLSHPVLMGFINAAAILISLSQVPAFLGFSLKQGQGDHFLLAMWNGLRDTPEIHYVSLAFGICALAMLLAFRRFLPRIPGVLLTVAALTWVSYAVGFADRGGRVVGEVPQGLPHPAMPGLDWPIVRELLPAAFVIALISFMEAASSCKVIATKTRKAWDENRELVGQGLAKIAAAFSDTMPVSGSFSRSALNLASGARTGLSSVLSAFFVLLSILFLAPYMYHLPKPILAAIIMIAVFGLINLRSFSRSWRANRDDGIAALATFVATLVFAPNIQNGILTGIIVSLALFLYRGMHPRIVAVGLHPDGTLRDAARFGLPPIHPAVRIIRIDASLTFVTVSHFEEAVLRMERDSPAVRFILIAASGMNELDASGVELLGSLAGRLRQNGTTLAMSAAKKQVLDVMERTGLVPLLGAENLYLTDAAAVEGLAARASGLDPAGTRSRRPVPQA